MAVMVGEVIRAVAEGTRGGIEALRAAGLTADVDAFDVEVDYAGGADPRGGPGEVSATLRVRLALGPGRPVSRNLGAEVIAWNIGCSEVPDSR
jgi:hypothetical protein